MTDSPTDKGPRYRDLIMAMICVSVVLPSAVALVGNRVGLDDGWYGAVGTWAGAIASSSAIVWAIHAFQLDRKAESRKHQSDQYLAQGNANDIAVLLEPNNARGGGHALLSGVLVTVRNGSMRTINIRDVNVDGLPENARAQPHTVARSLAPTEESRFTWTFRPEVVVESARTANDLHTEGYLARVTFDQSEKTWMRTSLDETATMVYRPVPASVDE